MPLLPARIASQFACVPMPSGDTSPTPVTTTRLLNRPPTLPGLKTRLLLPLGVRLDVLDGFLHARDLLGVLVRNLDPELFLEGHHELDGVERVGAEVVDERGVRRDFLFVNPELLHDDALHLVCYGHSTLHWPALKNRPRSIRRVQEPGLQVRIRYMYIPPLTARTCPVIYDASSEARKHTAAAISSGVPRRFNGIFAAQSSRVLSV